MASDRPEPAEEAGEPDEPDLDSLITELRELLETVPAGSRQEGEILADLAAALVERQESAKAHSADDYPAEGPAPDLDEAIRHTGRYLAAYPPEADERPYVLYIAAVARYGRFLRTRDPADLDTVIANLREIERPRSNETTGTDDIPVEALALLGDALTMRYELAPEGSGASDGDLSEAIRVHQAVYENLADDDPGKAGLALDLGDLYYDRYGLAARSAPHADTALCAASRAGDLDQAVGCFRLVRDSAPGDADLLAAGALKLGLVLTDRVLRGGDSPADVSEAISALTLARQLLSADEYDATFVTRYLGILFGVRFSMHAGPPSDRQDGIAALRETLDEAADPDASPDEADLARVWLAQLLMTRTLPPSVLAGSSMLDFDFATAAEVGAAVLTDEARAEAAEAVRHLSRVRGDGGPDPDIAVAALLGCALIVRGADGIPEDDLELAVKCFANATARVGPADSGFGELMAMHAWSLAELASRPGHRTDLDPVAERLAQARRLLPERHPLQTVILRYLGVILGLRGTQRSHAPDLEAGITALTEALGRMPAGSPSRTETIGLLAAALLSSAQFSLSAVPIDKVIDLLTDARSHPHPDPGQRATHLCCYGHVLHLRAVRDGAHGDFQAAANVVKEAATLIGEDHDRYPYLLLTLSSMLTDQYTFLGSLEALDAAAFYTDKVVSVLQAAGGPAYHLDAGADLATARALRGTIQLRRGQRRLDPALLEEAAADLRFAVDNRPPDHPFQGLLESELATALGASAALREDRIGLADSTRGIVEAAKRVPAGHPDRSSVLGRAGNILVTRGRLGHDLRLLDEGLALLNDSVADQALAGSESAAGPFSGVGSGFVSRFEVSRVPADLDCGIEWLERASQVLAGEPGSPVAAIVLADLAAAYRRRGDASRDDPWRSVETGLAALRERAGDVLLQTGPERGLAMARTAALEAADVASWSLEDCRLDAAVAALELGRGLVLHAATVTTDLPAVLESAGHGGLAGEWAAATAGAGTAAGPWDAGALAGLAGGLPAMTVPSDLRHRALLALAGSPAERALLAPPDLGAIAAALRSSRTDAICYLLPAGEAAPARAVAVWPDGTGEDIPLPKLTTGRHSRVEMFAQAQEQELAPGQERRRRFGYALGDLCDWAWPAVMERVLSAVAVRTGSARLPRITLIPFGALGMVPWHAARSQAPGTARYACQQAVLSYAASARQVVAAAARDAQRAADRPVFVTDPVGGGFWAGQEAKSILAAYYPGGRHLTSGGGEEAGSAADRVLAQLSGHTAGSPGAALLHVSCHARTGLTPATSCLRLSHGESLAVGQILRQAQRRQPGLPGGLVVLSACVSDLSMRDYDEALTLATAFFAAGAASVVGTRWEVPDVRTSILMFMFHHYLAGGQPPGDALRSAQLWMIGPEREIPPEMPSLLAEEVPFQDLAEILAWAGFTHQGRSWPALAEVRSADEC